MSNIFVIVFYYVFLLFLILFALSLCDHLYTSHISECSVSVSLIYCGEIQLECGLREFVGMYKHTQACVVYITRSDCTYTKLNYFV